MCQLNFSSVKLIRTKLIFQIITFKTSEKLPQLYLPLTLTCTIEHDHGNCIAMQIHAISFFLNYYFLHLL
jgi:hypothetical protein